MESSWHTTLGIIVALCVGLITLAFLRKLQATSLAERTRLTDFRLRALQSMDESGLVALGRFEGLEGDAMVIIKPTRAAFAGEKTPEAALRVIHRAKLELKKQNTNYGYYTSLNAAKLSPASVEVIWPVDPETVERKKPRKWIAVRETRQMYEQSVKPIAYGEQQTKRQQWVYAILDGESEQDDVVHADEHFVIVTNPKWNKRDMNQLLLLAIPTDRDIRSVRDLDGQHLPLLTHMQERIFETVASTYQLKAEDILVYFHYPPQFYHLHLHICHVMRQHDRGVERARLLDDVIANLSMDGDYYKEGNMLYSTKEESVLHKALRDMD